MFKSKKGQVALEVLVIFGVLVVGSIIFGLFYMNNVKDILVEGPGTKQDKNGGGDVYDDLEGSLIYNDEEQIGSSSHGITGGSGGTGGTGGTDNPEDPPVLYCGDGICDSGEEIACPQDCITIGSLDDLEIILDPETSSYGNQNFNIIVNAYTDYPILNVTQIEVKKRNEYGTYISTNNCEFDNSYSSIFSNPGTLIYDEENDTLTNTFTFSCNTLGNYDFKFTVSDLSNTDSLTGSVVEAYGPNGKEIISHPLEFISVWDTTRELGELTSTDAQISLPLVSNGEYNFNVDWNDGTTDTITSWNQPESTHTYIIPGIYELKITGQIKGFNFYSQYIASGKMDSIKLMEIKNWGPLNLGNDGFYFANAQNLYITATDFLDLNGTTNLSGLFQNCYNLTIVPNISEWNVSNVTDMSNMFSGASSFNQDIGYWNVSNVTDMSNMFSGATSFNQNINGGSCEIIGKEGYCIWDVSNVTNMSNMFSGATSFNEPLNLWILLM
jgi:surface protein